MKSGNRCSICEGKCVELYSLYDDRYGYPESFLLFECRVCRHKLIKDEFSVAFLSELYSKYYPRATFKVEDYKKYKEVSGFRAWLDGVMSSAFRWVPENVRVLDIGCGFGESLGYFESRGCTTYGVEADENIRRVAERFGFKVHVGLFNPDIYEPEFFDYVTMAQVIEHVVNPVETMQGISRILKKGGRLIISTPNSGGWGAKIFKRRWINWHAPYHLQHFSIFSMKIAAAKSGLIVEKDSTITNSEWLHYQWCHLVTYPRMGVPSGFWSPIGKLSILQKATLFILNIIHKSKVNHLITRLFDFVHMGDNFLFILRKP